MGCEATEGQFLALLCIGCVTLGQAPTVSERPSSVKQA